MLRGMIRLEEVWIPLVDKPIGTIVAQVQKEHPEIAKLVETPQRRLAFKTFAYIRVGLLLGELLVENDIDPDDGSETWIDQLLDNPEYMSRVVEEIRAVADEVSRDIAEDAPLGPDEAARERLREFARRHRESL